MYYDNVEKALEKHKFNRGLTALELQLIVNKARRSIYQEINYLMSNNKIEREEVKTKRKSVIIYHYIS